MNTFGPEGDPGFLVSHCASEIEMVPVEWLWRGRIAIGKHTCIAAEPGTGKSQVATYIAAQISMGASWPCNEGSAPQGSVLILSAEDGEADTIVPRLHVAKADLGRVHIISAVRTDRKSSRGFNLQADIELLEQKIKQLGDVAMIIIDPISSYLGKLDSHKNAEVRGVLEPLGAMAERKRVAVLSVTHFSKAGAANTKRALDRFIGSVAFVGAPRIAFAVIEDPDDKDRRLFLHAKNNLAAPPQGLAFRLRQTTVGEGISASSVDWEREHVHITANEALAAEADSDGIRPIEEAEAFLKDELADGPVPTKQVKADADAAGMSSWATIRRAKDRLGVVIKREGFGPGGTFLWALPDTIDAQIPIDAHVIKRSTYDESEHLCGDMDFADYPDLLPFLDRRGAK
jgi:putative DNA primase/helicase